MNAVLFANYSIGGGNAVLFLVLILQVRERGIDWHYMGRCCGQICRVNGICDHTSLGWSQSFVVLFHYDLRIAEVDDKAVAEPSKAEFDVWSTLASFVELDRGSNAQRVG